MHLSAKKENRTSRQAIHVHRACQSTTFASIFPVNINRWTEYRDGWKVFTHHRPWGYYTYKAGMWRWCEATSQCMPNENDGCREAHVAPLCLRKMWDKYNIPVKEITSSIWIDQCCNSQKEWNIQDVLTQINSMIT